MPPSRSTRPKVTTWRTIADPCMPLLATRARACLFDEADERLVADRLDVLPVPHAPADRLVARGLVLPPVLQHRAERLLDDLRVDLLTAERGESLRPVDRLGDAGR